MLSDFTNPLLDKFFQFYTSESQFIEQVNTMQINEKSVEIALDAADGWDFESFSQSFLSGIFGIDFRPIGGIHDGGADGVIDLPQFQQNTKQTTFVQCSVQSDYVAKINKTIDRLKESGREVKKLIYITNRKVQNLDKEEYRLSDLHDVSIQILDKDFIRVNVNRNDVTVGAFESHLDKYLTPLQTFGHSIIRRATLFTAPPDVYVFLRQTIDRKENKSSLSVALTDGLILKALEGTEPNLNEMSVKQVEEKIGDLVPGAQKIVRSLVKSRLEALSRVQRQVRYVRRHGEKYCLSFELRKKAVEDNMEDESLRVRVKDLWHERIKSISTTNGWLDDEPKQIVETMFEVIQDAFYKRGLSFAAFLENREPGPDIIYLEESVSDVFSRLSLSKKRERSFKEAILESLRVALYKGTSDEKLYFHKLSLTYTLLFSLQNDASVAQFFQGLTGDLHLFVGSDVVIKALSEEFLDPANRVMTNSLEIIRRAGGRLVLTEIVLKEILGHLQSTDQEYKHNYQPIENSLNLDIARQIDKILIRAFFYAKFGEASSRQPRNWQSYLNSFLPYTELNNYRKALNLLQGYLMNHFGMIFVSYSDIVPGINKNQRHDLASSLENEKNTPKLADNDAVMALAVYARRNREEKQNQSKKHGFSTWWLTDEIVILRHAQKIIQREGVSFMMRPQFLINHLSLAPSQTDVRENISKLLPGTLGLSMARRVPQEVLLGVLQTLRDAQGLSDARRQAEITSCTNEIKSQYYGSIQEKSGKSEQVVDVLKNMSRNRTDSRRKRR
jgi:hypothetical protein